ncbi:AAA family ATPase [Desulfovibrio oxyclinae]|uniref:AAA family ATPase n=1 Tax=Desulfovibrio oxyclinae TaxID=63560 RepID=UPI00035FAA70|nr:AAA family ATPase [Desulfovibrio oxyclinae]
MNFAERSGAERNWVRRHEALSYCRLADGQAARILLIQARAGQGKTTLAEQLSQEFEGRTCWCDCSPSDADHVGLLEKLCQSFTSISGFDASTVLAAARSSQSAVECVIAVSKGLPTAFPPSGPPVLAVIDDAHLLQEHPASLAVLRAFIDASPQRVTFCILTRTTLLLDDSPLFSFHETISIDDDILALTGAEVAQIQERVFGRKPSNEECAAILIATGGWTAGVLLLGSGTVHRGSRMEHTPAALAQYFEKTCLADADRQAWRELMFMSLPDEFPASFAEDLSLARGTALAGRLARRNLFVRLAERCGWFVYRFHHLFRDTLRTMARDNLTPEECNAFLTDAAWLFASRGLPERAAVCLASAKNWPALADLFRQYGLKLVNANHLAIISQVCAQCPDEVRSSHPWLELMSARASMNANPGRTRERICNAMRRFRAQGDRTGELIAIAMIIHCDTFFTGMLRLCAQLLSRACTLYEHSMDTLSASEALFCDCALLLGFNYCAVDNSKWRLFHERAMENSRKLGMETPPPEINNARVLHHTQLGDIDASLSHLDALFSELESPALTDSVKMTLHIMYMNSVLMKGDFCAYRSCKQESVSLYEDIFKQTHLGGFLEIWDADMLFATGDLAGALDRAQALLEHPVYGNIPHISSQAHQYLALIHALSDRKEKALANAFKACSIRASCGGWFFLRLAHTVLGSTLILCGEHHSGQRVLGRCLQAFAKAGGCYLAPQALAYKAWSHLQQEDIPAAMQDVESMLGQMERQKNSHFFYQPKAIMDNLLHLAAKNGPYRHTAMQIEEVRRVAFAPPTVHDIPRLASTARSHLENDRPWHAHSIFSAMAATARENPASLPTHVRQTLYDGFSRWIDMLRRHDRPRTALAAARFARRIFPSEGLFMQHEYQLKRSGAPSAFSDRTGPPN